VCGGEVGPGVALFVVVVMLMIVYFMIYEKESICFL
jgi:hypothetical protein